jgi:altronate dehydratase large subunit
VVGNLFDRIVDAGGSAIFSETTEVIGAEHIVARRFEDPVHREKFLTAVKRVEDESKATGEDIRSINPIPANIAAGLTTLEEKSLGAVAKSGKRPMKECVAYAEPVTRNGMHFMDAWMSSSALFLGLAATGTILNIFQVGGGWMPKGALMPSADSGLVTPTLYMTGNPRCYEKAKEEMDFNAGSVISEKESIASAGGRLAETVCRIASGMPTRGECISVNEPLEVYFRGPAL